MDINKLMGALCLIGATFLTACNSCGNKQDDVTVSKEMYDDLQQKYDVLKESVDGTLSANEKAQMELNSIMVELNSISGKTIQLQKNVESGKGSDNRTTSERISEAIAQIKKRLNAVRTDDSNKQTLALVKNLRQTIALNEQEITRLNAVIEGKNTEITNLNGQVSDLDSKLQERNEQLQQSLQDMKRAEIESWMSMGNELVRTADLLPNVKGHGNMKEIKQAKLTILLRAKSSYTTAYQLGHAEALSKIRSTEAKYQEALNR